jgi:hypothetical protein
MGTTGLINKILVAVENIDAGRKGFTTDGRDHEGRLAFENGITTAMAANMTAAQNSYIEKQKAALAGA